MTVVVGYIPHPGGYGALDLGLQLAHALGESLCVVTVVPRQWSTPSLAKIDAEYVDYARQVGEQAERSARAYLADTSAEVPTDFQAVTGRSTSSALVAAVEELDASMLVLGSSGEVPAGDPPENRSARAGAGDRIVLGSTADKLLHSSPVALALAPRGFASRAADGVSRVTCAFSDSASSVRVVARVAELTARLGVGLRVASFGVRGKTMYPPGVGLSVEDSVLESWSTQAARAQQDLVADGVVPADVPRVIATGTGWDESVASLPWLDGELLALGSSTVGPLARVFLGSRATKLVRYSRAPVVVVPSDRD